MQTLLCSSPSLRTIGDAYGDNKCVAWIYAQVAQVALMTGVKKDESLTMQVSVAAESIASNYGYLKVTDLMLFFSLFKSGMFGKFYGTFDVLVLTSSLSDFCTWRAKQISEHRYKQIKQDEERQREMRRQQFEREVADGTRIGYSEWLNRQRHEGSEKLSTTDVFCS